MLQRVQTNRVTLSVLSEKVIKTTELAERLIRRKAAQKRNPNEKADALTVTSKINLSGRRNTGSSFTSGRRS